MQAAVLREFSKSLSLEEVDTPTLVADDVLIKVMASGIDETDLKLIKGFGYRPNLPFILGHESADVVYNVGSAVKDIKVGDCAM